MEKPKDITPKEWTACQEFAFIYARQQGWYEDIDDFTQISQSETYGEEAYKIGLNLAIVSCKYWRKFYSN